MAEQTLIDLCLKGAAVPSQVDSYIERWHKGEIGRSMELRELLGMTCYEYSEFLKDSEAFPRIVAARRAAVGKK